MFATNQLQSHNTLHDHTCKMIPTKYYTNQFDDTCGSCVLLEHKWHLASFVFCNYEVSSNTTCLSSKIYFLCWSCSIWHWPNCLHLRRCRRINKNEVEGKIGFIDICTWHWSSWYLWGLLSIEIWQMEDSLIAYKSIYLIKRNNIMYKGEELT